MLIILTLWKSILFKTTVVFFMVFKFWIKSKQTNRVVDMNRVWQIVKNVIIYIYILNLTFCPMLAITIWYLVKSNWRRSLFFADILQKNSKLSIFTEPNQKQKHFLTYLVKGQSYIWYSLSQILYLNEIDLPKWWFFWSFCSKLRSW